MRFSRRKFLQTSSLAAAQASTAGMYRAWGQATAVGPRPAATRDSSVEVVFPRDRVPLSFVIDDSTCLVNMGHYCMPQFAQAWPDRPVYDKPWQEWPREIPDRFVRRFGEWCAEHGVKGKYSIVPNPACVGWLDRELPGWSRRQLKESLRLVRELMMPHWDIHPEMITHTRVIDLKTGRPLEPANSATMENSYPQEDKSVDEMAAYMAYALRILRNCDLECEGITTPGGFGNRVKADLPVAVDQAVRDVYPVTVSHFFKYVSLGDESVEPTVHVVNESSDGNPPQVIVSVPAGTGDWFGGWDGVTRSQGFRYCRDDASGGRMVELIERHQPAIMLCHWPGMYCNGTEQGFQDFQQVVVALESRFADRIHWMKMSDIAKYWAARELADVSRTESRVEVRSAFAARDFTLKVNQPPAASPRIHWEDNVEVLRQVGRRSELKAGCYYADSQNDEWLVCWDLQVGTTRVQWGASTEAE